MSFVDHEFVGRRADAIRGSEMLRDAILKTMGHAIPDERVRVRNRNTKKRKTITVKRKVIVPPHPPECCDKCGSPVNPIAGMISHIQATVAGYYGLHVSTMTSARRGFEIAHPRQLAMFLASELTPKSLPDIGKRFGGRDHTTVIHAIRAVKKRVTVDAEVAEDLRILRAVLAPQKVIHNRPTAAPANDRIAA